MADDAVPLGHGLCTRRDARDGVRQYASQLAEPHRCSTIAVSDALLHEGRVLLRAQVERAQNLHPGTSPRLAGTHFARRGPRLRRNSTHESASGWLTLWQLRRPTVVGQPLPRRLARSRRLSFTRRGAAIGVRPAGRTRRVPRIDRNPLPIRSGNRRHAGAVAPAYQ
jgi:hypothetical protein